MKGILSAILMVLLAGSAMGQRPEVGFVRIVNLVAGGEGNLNCSLDGQDLFAPGYTLGQKTGGMGLKVGKYEVAFKKSGCNGAKKEIEIENGKTQTLIAYGEAVRDDLGEIVGWNIKVGRLSQKTPEQGFLITLVSFCEESELDVTIVAEGTPDPIRERIPKMKAHSVKAGKPQGGVRVAVGKTPVAGFYTDDPGNYVVLIYSGADGAKEAIHYYDPRFLVAG